VNLLHLDANMLHATGLLILYVEGETDTFEFKLAFEHFVRDALGPEDSREFILRSARQLWA